MTAVWMNLLCSLHSYQSNEFYDSSVALLRTIPAKWFHELDLQYQQI